MPGLTGVANAAASRNSMNNENNKEVFFYDGTTVGFSVLSTGEDDNIDHISRHYVVGHGGKDNKRYVHCRASLDDSLTCWVCDTIGGTKPQMLFTFWAYVHTVKTERKPQNTENWTEKTVRGKTFWEMAVNEPRILTLPVGRKDIYLNNFIDIYQMGNGGEGGFDKVVNIARRGAGRDDTTYTMLATSVDAPLDALPSFNSVENLREYFLNKVNTEDAFYSNSGASSNTTVDADEDDDDKDDLPF